MTDVSSGQFLQGPCPSLALSELPFLSTPPLFDVRTAEEYTQGYIPGALNQPLFDHLERSTIGTLYKQVSPDSAKAVGLCYAEPRIQKLLESFQPWQKVIRRYFPYGVNKGKGQVNCEEINGGIVGDHFWDSSI